MGVLSYIRLLLREAFLPFCSVRTGTVNENVSPVASLAEGTAASCTY